MNNARVLTDAAERYYFDIGKWPVVKKESIVLLQMS
jgi:hypothetical protein